MPFAPIAGRVAVFLLAGPLAGSSPVELSDAVVSPADAASAAVRSSRGSASSWALDWTPQEHKAPTSTATRRILLRISSNDVSIAALCFCALAELRFELGEVLLAELRHFGCDHHLTVRLILVVAIVPLVIVLGLVEGG